MKIHLRRLVLGFCLAGMIQAAQAALTVNTTRVVFDSDKRSTSVVIANPSPRPYAVQSWIDTAEDDTDTAVPLATSPGLFRLDPGKEQMVQISRLPNKLPKDRETLFYLNIQEIPEVTSEDVNVLTIALRTRLKLFYRPCELEDRRADGISELKWSVRQGPKGVELVVHNPTPYHYTFGRLEVSTAGQTEAIQAMAMAPPFDLQVYDLANIKTLNGLQLIFTTINDHGVATPPLQKALSSLP